MKRKTHNDLRVTALIVFSRDINIADDADDNVRK